MSVDDITPNQEKTVTISEKRYVELLESERMLSCLETAGVDNWDGYYYACRRFYGDRMDDDDFEG